MIGREHVHLQERREKIVENMFTQQYQSLSPPTQMIKYINGERAIHLIRLFTFTSPNQSQEPWASIQHTKWKTRMGRTAKFESSWSAVSKKPRKTYNRRLCIRIIQTEVKAEAEKWNYIQTDKATVFPSLHRCWIVWYINEMHTIIMGVDWLNE